VTTFVASKKQTGGNRKAFHRVGIFFQNLFNFFTMKHLKIYFAVLFFSFLGSANAELMAQSNTCKYGEELIELRSDNGQYTMRLFYDKQEGDNNFRGCIYIVQQSTIKIAWEQRFPGLRSDKCYVGKGRIYVGDNPSDVLIGGNNGQGTGTFIRLHNDGELAIYGGSWRGDGDKVWSSGTCGGVLGGCGPVGPR
jgi:hypothetical protein